MRKFETMKRSKLFMLAAALITALLLFPLAACNENGGDADDRVTMNFVAEGLEIPSISAKAGEKITPPADPAIDGYKFKGWYLDPGFGGTAATLPTVMPERDTTYYAKFAKAVGYTIEIYLRDIEGTALKDTYSLYDTVNETGEVGEAISAEYKFANGTRVSHEGEVLSGTLNADESQNVFKLYYDRKIYTVRYNKNAEDATGEMQSVEIPFGATVKAGTLSACAFRREGYRFAGWGGSASGGGDTLPSVDFIMNGDYDLYAIWDREFTLAGEPNAYLETNKMYISSIINLGLGRVYFFYGDGTRKEGFLEASEFAGSDEVMLFSFYADTDTAEGEEIRGEINLTQGTFRFAGEEIGTYIRYSYQFDRVFVGSDSAMFEAIRLDGFGKMIYGAVDIVGGFQASYYGTYAWNEEYGDYTFSVLDAVTQQPTDEAMYFRLGGDKEIEGETYATFLVQGQESNGYYEYDILEGGKPGLLQLDGYGNARLYEIPDDESDLQLVSKGIYRATELYEDESGEWEYVPEGGAVGFKFINTYTYSDSEVVYIFLKYNEQLDITFEPEVLPSTALLVINGYNSAMYIPNGASAEDAVYGSFVMNGNENLIMTVYAGTGDDITTSELMFSVDLGAKTFRLNEEGFIREGDTITGYNGKSANIEIPATVTAIAEEAFRYDNPHTNLSHVSLSSVTIPASVISIGAGAFVNNYTLVRVTFLSPTPIEIAWDPGSDPFRWAMEGEFKIIVPEGSEEAYRSAWTACKYKITSLTELANRPEWETDESGKILVAYNYKGEGNPEALELRVPDGITQIASNVFKNISFIKSIDLNGVTTLDEKAFLNCFGLESITAANLQEIGAEAFSGCESLKEAVLPKAVTIGDHAFAGCYALRRVSVGEKINSIGDYAFMYCHTESSSADPFMLELADGVQPFTVGGSYIFYGVETWRISVDTVDSVRKFLRDTTWSGCGYTRMWVRASENSAIVGEWVDLATMSPVTFGGRMETLDEAGYYELEGTVFTVWCYDSYSGSLEKHTGTYENGRITFSTSSSKKYTLVQKAGTLTYKAGGKTLEIDLSTYQAGWFETADGYDTYRISAQCTFNGKQFTFTGNGSSGKITIQGYEIDGIKHNVTFTLQASLTFTYKTSVHDVKGPFTAADGSEIYINYEGSMIYITGSLKRFVDRNGQPLVVQSFGTWTCIEHEGERFVFSFNYGIDNNKYFITAEVHSDSGMFEYECEIASSRTVLNSAAGKVIVLQDKQSNITDLQLMLPTVDGGVPQAVEATYRYVEEGGYYEFTVDFEVEYYDEENNRVYYEPSPLNGTYAVIIDLDAKTCRIIRI